MIEFVTVLKEILTIAPSILEQMKQILLGLTSPRYQISSLSSLVSAAIYGSHMG